MNKTKLIIDLTSLTIGVAGVILAIGDKIVDFHLPPNLVNAWPVVVFGATLADRIGNMVLNYIKSNDSSK